MHRNKGRINSLYGGVGEVEQMFGTRRCKLVYIEWINNKILLYSTENYIQYPVINHNGKEYEKECIYIHTHIYIYKMKLLYCIVVINKIL